MEISSKGKKSIEVTVAVLNGTIDKNQVIHLEVTTEDGTAKGEQLYLSAL